MLPYRPLSRRAAGTALTSWGPGITVIATKETGSAVPA